MISPLVVDQRGEEERGSFCSNQQRATDDRKYGVISSYPSVSLASPDYFQEQIYYCT